LPEIYCPKSEKVIINIFENPENEMYEVYYNEELQLFSVDLFSSNHTKLLKSETLSAQKVLAKFKVREMHVSIGVMSMCI
jgi:hypothetical protein